MTEPSPTSDEATPVEGAAGTDASRPQPVAPATGATPDPAPDDDPRATRVAAARAAWTRHLVDLGGRNTLLWYRDLPTGTLDLTTAHPGGVASMMAGRPTKLSELVREPAALEDARRRARAIAAKSRELAEERGILTCFLAVGMATWAARLPDGRPAPRSPAAPVLLRSCTLRPTGAAQGDYQLDLGPELELNPVLVNYLKSEQGITLDEDAIEALTTPDAMFDPYPVYAALGAACAGVPDFSVTPRLVVGTFSYAKLPMVADLAAQGDALADHDVVAALAGDPDALRAVRSELDRSRVDLDDPERDVLVLDADSSQQEAIEAVRSGSHLVVHGPPGTGKSQTIANLIATLAADGKRVLFVAEKRAAIDAVVGRLDRVGLGDLVLDLHAGAHGRRRVARELVDGARPPRPARRAPARGKGATPAADPVTSRVTAPAAARRAAADRLTEHVRSLHEEREPWGITLHEVQEAVSSFAALPVPPRSRVRLRGEVLAGLDRDEVTAAASAVTTVASLADWDADGAGDPWFGASLAPPTRRPRPASGSSGSPVVRSTRPHARSPTCSAASSCPTRPRPTTGGTCSPPSATSATPSRSSAPTSSTSRSTTWSPPPAARPTGARSAPSSAGSTAGGCAGRPAPCSVPDAPGRPARGPLRRQRAAGGLAPARRVRWPPGDPGRARPRPRRPRRPGQPTWPGSTTTCPVPTPRGPRPRRMP